MQQRRGNEEIDYDGIIIATMMMMCRIDRRAKREREQNDRATKGES